MGWIGKRDYERIHRTIRITKIKTKPMQSKHFISSLLFILSFASWSQEEEIRLDTLSVNRSLIDIGFHRNGQSIRKSDFRETVAVNQTAKEYFRKGNNQEILANIFAYAGSFSIGWFLGSFLFSETPDQVNWSMGAAGIVGVLISIPIASGAENNYKRAAKTYNKSLKNDLGFWNRSKLNLNISSNKIGLCLKF